MITNGEYFIGLDRDKHNITISAYPDKCPICGNGIKPESFGGYETFTQIVQQNNIFMVFRCTLAKCRAIFLGYYRESMQSPDYFVLQGTFLRICTKYPELPEMVEKISPKFKIIYYQAYIADSNGLDEICGSGYRRSLEFLIKDYLIYLNKGKKPEKTIIKNLSLSKCIEKIDNEMIKAVAKRATWLGNDEVHYLRKWNKLDLANLKDLILLTINWIDSGERTKKYISTMPEK
jgi:hypothetical protein